NDLWSIGLMPGTASHPAGAAVEMAHGRKSGAGPNIDGHSIVAHNIISDFGYGTAAWNWPVNTGGMAPIRLGAPGFGEHGKDPETGVVLDCNIVYDTGRDQVLVDGKPVVKPPRWQYTVKFADGPNTPRDI